MYYGATIYQSAKPYHKKIIDTSINANLRFAVGSFRSSPIGSIRNLALEPLSELRHKENPYSTLVASQETLATQQTNALQKLPSTLKIMA